MTVLLTGQAAPAAFVPRQGGRPAAHRAVHRRHAAARPDPLRQLLPQALVVVVLAGGTCALLAGDKEIHLSVDGEPRTVHTFAGTVPELLHEQHIEVGAHDLVAPGRDAPLHDGDAVAVRYGRPIALTLDGHSRQVWTTARTVAGALRQLGVRADGTRVSASRDEPIGRRGLRLRVLTERTVTVLADGRERSVRTSAATVRDAIEQAGIALHRQDSVSADLDSFPHDGQTISVTRVSGITRTQQEEVPFRTLTLDDPTLLRGVRVVDTEGRAGLERVTYAYRIVDGVHEAPRRIATEVLRAPVDEVVRVGTKAVPAAAPGADRLNWRALAHCEAGGRPHAVDPSGRYGGLYQFDSHTWHTVGGSGRPQDAPRSEQTYRAKKLYVMRGAGAWPSCGRHLYHH